MQDLKERWQDAARRSVVLKVAQALEVMTSLAGLSSYSLAVAVARRFGAAAHLRMRRSRPPCVIVPRL